MTIRFPKVHIATSVVNKILNVADGVNAAARASQLPPPAVPDVGDQSLQLDTALASGLPTLPGIDQAPNAGATLSGAPLISTVLEPGP